MLLALGIAILLLELKTQIFHDALNAWAIRRVQTLVQEREEFKNHWLGVGVIQYPSDLLGYAELINETRPEAIIETGTNYGGLAIFLATLLQNLDPNARVITVDIDSDRWEGTKNARKLPDGLLSKITFLQGDSVSNTILEQVKNLVGGRRAMVILDSLHTSEHVLKELNLYSQFVAPNSFLIVNDTHLEHLRMMGPGEGIGPLTAVHKFLQSNSSFVVDSRYPRSIISCAPSGFLKRVR